MEKISYDSNSSTRFKNIKRFETELKWIKLLQTPFLLGFNENIYHEGNVSKMPDFDVRTLLESRKRKSRSHCIRKRGNDKQNRCAAMKLNTSLSDLAAKQREHGRHSMLSYLSSLPIAVLRSLDTNQCHSLYLRTSKIWNLLLFVTNITNRLEIQFLISINLFLILISMLIPGLGSITLQCNQLNYRLHCPKNVIDYN